MRGPNKRPRTPEYLAQLSENTRRRWQENRDRMCEAAKLGAAPRIVVFTPEMTATMFEMFWRGRHLDMIAERIGVSRPVLRREVNRHNLPNRARIPGFMRKGPYSRPTPPLAALRQSGS